MKIPTVAIGLVSAFALAIAPLSSASARGWHHGGGGWGDHGGYHHHGGGNPALWPFLAVGAVVTGAVALATLPVRAIAEAPEPAPAYYPPPAYYPAPHRVVYGYPPAYAYPAPVYATPEYQPY